MLADGQAAERLYREATERLSHIKPARRSLARTVEWHLGKVFGKLGLNSRKELQVALSDVGAAVIRHYSPPGPEVVV
jgi:hypothetical protein